LFKYDQLQIYKKKYSALDKFIPRLKHHDSKIRFGSTHFFSVPELAKTGKTKNYLGVSRLLQNWPVFLQEHSL
jgi:hypothetical protein